MNGASSRQNIADDNGTAAARERHIVEAAGTRTSNFTGDGINGYDRESILRPDGRQG